MCKIIHFDFRTGRFLSSPEVPRVETSKQNEGSIFDQWAESIELIRSRYGDCQPSQGVIYKQSFRNKTFDTYGFGNIHSSFHQYRPKKDEVWNRPTPMPADLHAIDAFLKKNAGKTVTLGHKSDAFMWMERKYNITLFTLQLANRYGVKLTIQTMSDLCALGEYADLIAQGRHTVVMNMGLNDGNENIERVLSPGAPSLKRRQDALDILKSMGVPVKIKSVTREELLTYPIEAFRRLGWDRERTTLETLKQLLG